MIINTRFNVGDEIYYRYGKGIIKCEVEAILITFTEDITEEDSAISYRTRNGRTHQRDAMNREEAVSALADMHANETKKLFGSMEKEGSG